MKRSRSLLVVLMTLALLISLACVPASAAETVISTLDFTTMAADGNADSAAETILAAGAVEVGGIGFKLESCHCVQAMPADGHNNAWIVQKIEAGEGKTFTADPVLDLTYFLSAADTSGAVRVFVSEDNAAYTEVFARTEGAGDEWTLTAQHNDKITLTGGAGKSILYVKIQMIRFGGPTSGSIVKSVITATVSSGAAVPAVPGPRTSVLDFSAMAADGEPKNDASLEYAKNTLIAAGAVDVHKLVLWDCIRVQATPIDGYAEGYFIQKIDAGEGLVFENDPVLDLKYSLAANTQDPGSIKVEVSTDGVSYTQVYLDNVGQGEDFNPNAEIEKQITLTGGKDSQIVYIKVAVVRCGGQASGSIIKSVINGTATTPASSDDGGSDNTGDMIGIVAALAVVCGLGLIVTSKKSRKF